MNLINNNLQAGRIIVLLDCCLNNYSTLSKYLRMIFETTEPKLFFLVHFIICCFHVFFAPLYFIAKSDRWILRIPLRLGVLLGKK